MLGKLLNLLVLSLMLAALGWHYRDTETVRQRRPLIESTLAKLGVDEATVRKHWPLDGLVGKAAPSSAESATAAFIEAYNPIPKVRNQLKQADQAQQQRDEALKKAGN
jgi:hypothetical protein